MCGIAKLRYALADAVEMIVPTRDKSPDSRGWAACLWWLCRLEEEALVYSR